PRSRSAASDAAGLGVGFYVSELGDQHDDVLVEDPCRVALAARVFEKGQAARPEAPGLARIRNGGAGGTLSSRSGETAMSWKCDSPLASRKKRASGSEGRAGVSTNGAGRPRREQ